MRDLDRREREALDRYLTTEPLLDHGGAEWEPDIPEQPEAERRADEARANAEPDPWDEEMYVNLADELNDPSAHESRTYGEGKKAVTIEPMTVDDFDPEMVAAARRYAAQLGLAFPPGIGDFDRYYERAHR